MRDKLVDPVGLRTTAKPKKIVFQKRCSYRRKPISRRERLKPTQCELAAEQNARAAKSVLIKARMRFEVATAWLFTADACACLFTAACVSTLLPCSEINSSFLTIRICGTERVQRERAAFGSPNKLRRLPA